MDQLTFPRWMASLLDLPGRGDMKLNCFYPRLSQARDFLPVLRQYLTAAASRHPLVVGMTVDLLPISDDGLFGYELVPDRKTHTYFTVGCSAQGEPVLRKTIYGEAADGLRLVAIDGRILSRTERSARYHVRQRDTAFSDWPAATEAAFAQLLALFPERPRQPVALSDQAQRSLDGALAIAYSHLAQWDPFIRFCGLANEEQLGFALSGSRGQHGELVFQRPDIWMLRWKAAPRAVYESWSVVLDASAASARNDLAS